LLGIAHKGHEIDSYCSYKIATEAEREMEENTVKQEAQS